MDLQLLRMISVYLPLHEEDDGQQKEINNKNKTGEIMGNKH